MYAKSSCVMHNDDVILKLILNLDVNIYQKDYNNKNVLEYCSENCELKALDLIENK
jgi:ankyrin repeat protein